MDGLFNGWRRRVGLAVLILACLFMGCWMRSTWVVDQLLCVTDPHTLHAVFACPIGIGWSELHQAKSVSGFLPPFGYRSLEASSSTLTANSAVRPFKWIDKWDFDFLGFRSGTWESRTVPPAPLEVREIRVWIAPYWAFVWPLALISILLLIDRRVGRIRLSLKFSPTGKSLNSKP